MTAATNPHRPGTKSAKRWDERLAKNQARSAAIKAEQARRAAIVDDAREVASKLPAGFGDYDHTRVQAWKAAALVLKDMLGSVRLKPGGGGPTPMLTARLQAQADMVRRIGSADGNALAAIISNKGKTPKE